MSRPTFPRIAALKTAAQFRGHLEANGIPIAFDDELAPASASPLASPLDVDGVRIGNRFCVLPMEGWDGTLDGQPSAHTRRRWQRFGASGAKLIWGGEAVAVRHDGRASPNQLMLSDRNQASIAALREELVRSHRERFGAHADADLYIGLQLTHSGRFAKPNASDRPEPLTAGPHPILDRRVPGEVPVLSDDELDRLIDEFVVAAGRAEACGFQFVDVKLCHGYLGHELIGARQRPGRYGGSLENRLRFPRRIIEGIQASVPGMKIGVRLSAFDLVPYRKGAGGVGERDGVAPQDPPIGFGLLDGEDLDGALAESRILVRMLEDLGVRLVCVTGGSPYYCPHTQRPAFFPPADGYLPPEDPLRGVARQIAATALLKASFPGMTFVGSAYSYLQEWLPNVGQYNVREGLTDFVGLGRIVLSYPDLPVDVLAGRALRRGDVCRTFSDCTTGPRLGLISGCYPLDSYYKAMPEAARVQAVRTSMTAGEKPAPDGGPDA
jgi:2,4-dienoyl-CoA reductase-like NADH-dependent reductase (Old Yellow Enzyme family)